MTEPDKLEEILRRLLLRTDINDLPARVDHQVAEAKQLIEAHFGELQKRCSDLASENHVLSVQLDRMKWPEDKKDVVIEQLQKRCADLEITNTLRANDIKNLEQGNKDRDAEIEKLTALAREEGQ